MYKAFLKLKPGEKCVVDIAYKVQSTLSDLICALHFLFQKINIQKAKELERMRQHEKFNLLPLECQQLHDHKHVERILDDL